MHNKGRSNPARSDLGVCRFGVLSDGCSSFIAKMKGAGRPVSAVTRREAWLGCKLWGRKSQDWGGHQSPSALLRPRPPRPLRSSGPFLPAPLSTLGTSLGLTAPAPDGALDGDHFLKRRNQLSLQNTILKGYNAIKLLFGQVHAPSIGTDHSI